MLVYPGYNKKTRLRKTTRRKKLSKYLFFPLSVSVTAI